MLCPACRSDEINVTDSRSREMHGKGGIYRRRRCAVCGERWSTFELSFADLNWDDSSEKAAVKRLIAKLMEMI